MSFFIPCPKKYSSGEIFMKIQSVVFYAKLLTDKGQVGHNVLDRANT